MEEHTVNMWRGVISLLAIVLALALATCVPASTPTSTQVASRTIAQAPTVLPTSALSATPTLKSSPMPSVKSPTSTAITPDQTWATYNNNNPKYTIKYPRTWVLDRSHAEFSEKNNYTVLVIKGSEYEFELSKPSLGSGIDVCRFSDTNLGSYGGPFQEFSNENFIQITNSRSIYRRTVKPNFSTRQKLYPRIAEYTVANDDDHGWIICKKQNAGFFVDGTEVGYIRFWVPSSNYDKSMLLILDQILQALQY